VLLAAACGLLAGRAAPLPAQAPPAPDSPVPPSPAPAAAGARPATPADLARRLEEAWRARDTAGYLALWRFADGEQRAREERFAALHFTSDELLIHVQPARRVAGAGGLTLPAQLFTVAEPRARAEEVLFRALPEGGGWVITEREERPGIEGLMHLSLGAEAYQAAGVRLTLEDFELEMREGSLFTSPASLGPTAVVFVGRGTVRFRPRPEAEREQLRQFAGAPELVTNVDAAFVRVHPADFLRVFSPGRLEPDPSGASRLRQARRVFAEHAESSFVLDASLPRSPWWLLPSLGEASVVFHGGRGKLTYTLSGVEPEGISLFDRGRRRQICLYPRAGRATEYDEDASRAVDMLHHDLRVRFDPKRFLVEGEDTVRLQVNMATPTLRLRLHEDLTVQSVSSREGGEHLFFRIRHQDGLLVSLGALAGRIGEISLTVRYAGLHQPAPVERELQVAVVDSNETREEDVVIEPVLVYSNRTAWYPQSNADDFALARLRFEVPLEYMALTGGERGRFAREGGRTQVEYVQDQPGKYITVAVGRFIEVGRRQEGAVALEAYGVGRTRREAAALLDQSAALLPFYSAEFGAFPYKTLRVALVEGLTPGGHSPPGMVILAERPPLLRRGLRADPAGFWDLPGFFFAHELAHQWWGHAVAGQNYRERWISEAFAQYAAAMWARRSLGEPAFQEVLSRMTTWALRFTASGPIHLGYRLGHVKSNPQIYRAVVYDKGAYVLHMLRGLVGEDAFRRGLQSLQRDFLFRKAGTSDVRRALEQASGRDLTAYFDEWVMGTELPALRVVHRREAAATAHRTVVEVLPVHLPGPVPLELALTHGGGRELHTVQLPPEGGRWTFETPTPTRRVEANANRGLLARVKDD
jgi:hypothetical protein